MDDIRINSTGIVQNTNTTKVAQKNDRGDFESVLRDAIDKVATIQEDVDRAVKELASGGDITSAILAIEKADMSFQLMVEIRNKLINAYEEVMRMQV